jgi:hypothetical protein
VPGHSHSEVHRGCPNDDAVPEGRERAPRDGEICTCGHSAVIVIGNRWGGTALHARASLDTGS